MTMSVDQCKHWDVPGNPRFYDVESEYYFTCSDCACYGCVYLHNCNGQCGQIGDIEAKMDGGDPT